MPFVRTRIAAAVVAATTAGLSPALCAQEAAYPVRAVRLVIPFSPGGGTDLVGRMVAQKLTESWGQLVVDNKAGASGVIGADFVAKSKADGYTLGMGLTATLSINPELFQKLPYDVLRDYTPVAVVSSQPVVLVVRADSPFIRLAMAIYGVGVLTMLAVSAVYHSGWLGPTGTSRLKRLDHATILLAVAGSYTGICSLALNGTPEVVMLTFVWTAAAVGTVIRMCWLHAPRWLTVAVYLVVGWSALVEIGPLMHSLGAGDTALLPGALRVPRGVPPARGRCCRGALRARRAPYRLAQRRFGQISETCSRKSDRDVKGVWRGWG